MTQTAMTQLHADLPKILAMAPQYDPVEVVKLMSCIIAYYCINPTKTATEKPTAVHITRLGSAPEHVTRH